MADSSKAKKANGRGNLFLGLGVVLTVAGFTTIVALGVIHLKPHLDYSGMRHSECVTIKTQVAMPPWINCSCAAEDKDPSTCQSSFPCTYIRVNVTNHHGNAMNVKLYNSYDTYLQQQYTDQCSFYKCAKDKEDNTEESTEFVTNYGRFGRKFECHFDPYKPMFAIVELVSRRIVIHSFIWPICALVSGIFILYLHAIHMGPCWSPKCHTSQEAANNAQTLGFLEQQTSNLEGQAEDPPEEEEPQDPFVLREPQAEHSQTRINRDGASFIV